MGLPAAINATGKPWTVVGGGSKGPFSPRLDGPERKGLGLAPVVLVAAFPPEAA